MDVQLRKGFLELCVLAALRQEDSYGYRLIREISSCIEISESTLYPILRRLEASGAVNTYQIPHNNRIRKYYHLTEEGRQILDSFGKERESIVRILDYITGGNAT